jgi:serine/threonine protein kinase
MKPVHVPEEDVQADGAGDTASTSQGQAMKIPDRPSMGLQRAESMSGNVLVVLEEGNVGILNQAQKDVSSNVGIGINQAQRAYWIQRKIGKTTHGSVRIGYVLRRREVEEHELGDESYGRGDAQWEVTPKESTTNSSSSISEGGGGVPAADAAYEMVAIKMYDKSKCTSNKASGPAVEVAASQLLARHAPARHHVLGSVDVLSDERHVYLIMPYCDGGDLLSVLESRGRLVESVARHIFQQILRVSYSLLMHALGHLSWSFAIYTHTHTRTCIYI